MQTSDIDLDLLEEFLNDLHQQVVVIEHAMSQVQQGSAAREAMMELNRAFHNLKGAAAMCRFELGVDIAHRIESLLSRIQASALPLSPVLGETVMLTVDRLEQSADALMRHQPIEQLHLESLSQGLEELIIAPVEKLDRVAIQVIEAVSGFRPTLTEDAGSKVVPIELEVSDDPIADLSCFRRFALQLEKRSPHFRGRTSRIRQLALSMNIAAGKPVDPMQLEAALYMHDVGMMFLPEPLWLKPGQLSEAEWADMRQHPTFAADILGRMKGWSEAAQMILQHHERVDGTGYPLGIKGDEVSPGAKILSIVDAFEAVMLKHAYRGQKVSMLRAAAEINGCDTQFAKEWIGPFNRIVKKLL